MINAPVQLLFIVLASEVSRLSFQDKDVYQTVSHALRGAELVF